ncbi:MAG: hypothetical protein HY711_09295 [Candidatus Melainabacteria bacterium]|nr:hypothetical protein [Candidatus Melainabacteria bacterium]
MSTQSPGWEQEVRVRQEFRCRMVQSFGFTVMDYGLALAICPVCKTLCSVNSAFSASDWDSLNHLVSVLETYLESPPCLVDCQQCHKDFTLTEDAGEYWLWHAHFLPESKRDLQVLMHRKKGATGWVEGMLVETNGAITPLPLPIGETEFKTRSGCHFSVRQAWRELLHNNWPLCQFTASEISLGYYLVVNPPVDSDNDLAVFKDNCLKLVGQSLAAGTEYEFADLSWADSWNFEESTYHEWLNEFEGDVEESDIIAGVLASPDQFYNIVQQEIEPFGCWLRQVEQNSQVAMLGDNEYYLSFDFRQHLLNAMIKGLSYWSALQFVEPILESWQQTRSTGERLRQLLTSYSSTVYGGRYLQLRLKRGKKLVKELDLTVLTNSEDEDETDSQFLERICKQIALNPQTLKFKKTD